MPFGLTQLQVYNRALDALGARAQLVSVTDVSPEANVLNDNFTSAFNFLLETYDWSFARVFTPLVPAPTGDILPGWAGVYSMPANALAFLGIWNGTVWGTQPVINFEVAFNGVTGEIIGTNRASPVGVYTYALTDPSQTSPLFSDALVYALASQSALDITGSAQIGPALMSVAMNQLENAKQRDGTRRRIAVGTRYEPAWIRERG